MKNFFKWAFSIFFLLSSLGALTSGCFSVFIVTFILAFINFPPFENFLINKYELKINKPLKFVFVTILLFSFFSLSYSYQNLVEPNKHVSLETNQVNLPLNQKQEEKNVYLSFQRQISDIEKPCTTYQAQLSTKLVNESGNLVEIYELAKQGYYICSEASSKTSKIIISDKLTEENKNKLEKVKEYMHNALLFKSMAMDEVKKFADDNKVSRISKAKEYFESGQSAVLMAGVQLAEVKLSVDNKK